MSIEKDEKAQDVKKFDFETDPRFQELFGPLVASEYELLDTEIVRDGGFRDNLVVGVIEGKKYLLDGHNRYYICLRHAIEIPDDKITEIEFSSIEDAIEWVINLQLGRRNLEKWQRCELGLKLEPQYKEIGRQRMAEAKSKAEGSVKSDQPWVSDDEVSKRVDVNPSYYKWYRQIYNEHPKALADIRSGEKSLSAVHNKLYGKEKPIKRSKTEGNSPDKKNGTTETLPPNLPPAPASKIGEQNSPKAPQLSKGNDLKITAPELSKEAAVKLAKAISGKTETPTLIPDWTLLDSSKALISYIRSHSDIGSIIPVMTSYDNRQLSFLVFRDVVATEGDFTICEADQIPLEAENLIEKCKKS